MFRIICVLIGYAIGCIQTSFIIGKLSRRIDIRDFGSGNAGTTNTIRVLGMKFGLLVFIFDVLKGVVAYGLCTVFFDGSGNFFSGVNGLLPGLYAGIGVILGHDFPFFMGFRGGKGIASTLGIIVCVDWRVMLVDFACGLCLVGVSRFISLASLGMTLLFPILLAVFDYPIESVVLAAILTAIAYIQHRGNIARLLSGTENKFNFGRK